MNGSKKYAATVVITTRNRKELLRDAITSTLAQQEEVEIIVMDDASTDGTGEMVTAEFPMVRLVATETRCGLIVQRNRAAEIATSPIVFSLDDDAIFSTPNIISQALPHFSEERVGALALPLINIIGGVPREFYAGRPSEKHAFWVMHAFTGAGYAVRRDLFLALGGFQGHLFHWGEEPEYSQRMLNAGRVVRLAMTDPIHHFPATEGRHKRGKNVWLYRNMILASWYTAPLPVLIPLLGLQTARCVARGASNIRQLPIALEGIVRGYASCFAKLGKRTPISLQTFRLFVELNRRRFVPYEEIAARLAPLA
ncbi:MAG: glycosyltransferase family 2 protein [Nitrospira sp.]|nr:glycosyltransferase family 2 protein [Nitrospira sp.]